MLREKGGPSTAEGPPFQRKSTSLIGLQQKVSAIKD